MPSLSITPLYAALAAFWFIALSLRVIWLRNVERVGIGFGDNPRMARAVRVQGNAAEYLPFALLLMLTAELGHSAPGWLHACGIALLSGRLLHALGLGRSAGRSAGRVLGTVLTFFSIITLAVLDLHLALNA